MPVPSNPQDLINIIREKLFNNTSGLIEEPDLREVLENIVKVLDAKFSMFSPNLTEEQFAQWNLILDYMANETKGVLSITSPAPTEKGKYLLSSAGTYTNLGGLVATADKLNYAYFDGTTWSKVEVPVTGESYDRVGKIFALKNGNLNPELPLEISNLGTPIKVNSLVLPNIFEKIGIEYFFKVTKVGTGNMEIYPEIKSEDAILPKANDYVRISYCLFGMEQPPILNSRQKLFLFSGSTQTSTYPIKAETTKLEDKCFKIDLFYKIPETVADLTHVWFEIILETNGYIPNGTDVYFGAINFTISNNDKFGINNELSMSQANAALKLARGAATKDELNNIYDFIGSKFKINSSIKGGNFDPVNNLSGGQYFIKNNAFLESINSPKISSESKNGSGNVECYIVFDDDKRAEYFANSGKFIKIKWKVFSKTGVMCTPATSGRLGLIGIQNSVSFSNGNVTYTQLNANIFEVTAIWQITQTSLPSIIWICNVWEADRVASDYVVGDLGVTAFGVWYGETAEELQDNLLQYDFLIDTNSNLTIAQGDERYSKIEDIPDPEKLNYNNVAFNQTAIAPFLKKYLAKEVDEFNQITIGLTGDSILGRQDNPSFNPANPEISLTEDMNNPNETQKGYVTGHFPPNMWEKLVGYEVLKMMQYKDADVKYYNHVASEITKSGNWIDAYPVGSDCLRLAKVTDINSYIELNFNSASFVKFIYSCYGANSMYRKIKVTFSDDNGTTWKTPSDLSLIESYPSDAEGSGIYYIPAKPHKWGNFIWKGLDKSKFYKIRVQKIDAIGEIAIWGFETWSNPRVNVVITAEGGNTAASQNSQWDRFYSSIYDQDLILYNVPYLNDLGVGVISQFKNSIDLTTAAPSNPTALDFYFVSENGTYSNFGNLQLMKGDYIEWTGSAWKKGSSQLKMAFSQYLSQNKAVYERAAKLGIPVLCLITHESTSFSYRPYTHGYGLLLQRLMVKEAGLPCIDINRFQEINNLLDVWSDGTHLNDKGVQMYIEPISEVLLPDNNFVGISSGKFRPEKLTGTSNSTNVEFGFEFKKVPTIRIFNNSGVSIVNKTKKGFSVSGSGTFEWEAFV